MADMLGNILRKLVLLPVEWLATVYDLLEKLAGKDGESWLEAQKRFLRKEDPWMEHLIDLDAIPFTPSKWSVAEHRQGGQFVFNSRRIGLYLDDQQKAGGIAGRQLREKLKSKPVFNANMLDWLIAHPDFIPEEWKGTLIVFWGTIYRDSDGTLYVRYLFWRNNQWHWSSRWLDRDFYDHNRAAVLAAA